MNPTPTRLPPAVEQDSIAPYDDFLRRILLILQIIETKANIVRLVLWSVLALLALITVV